MYVLTPLLNESYVKRGNGLIVQLPPMISQPNVASLSIPFGLVENLPGSSPNDTVEIFLQFSTANKPLVLSGRPLDLTVILNFDAGSNTITKQFLIVGPLLKPLLTINKTVEVRRLGCLYTRKFSLTSLHNYCRVCDKISRVFFFFTESRCSETVVPSLYKFTENLLTFCT